MQYEGEARINCSKDQLVRAVKWLIEKGVYTQCFLAGLGDDIGVRAEDGTPLRVHIEDGRATAYIKGQGTEVDKSLDRFFGSLRETVAS